MDVIVSDGPKLTEGRKAGDNDAKIGLSDPPVGARNVVICGKAK